MRYARSILLALACVSVAADASADACGAGSALLFSAAEGDQCRAGGDFNVGQLTVETWIRLDTVRNGGVATWGGPDSAAWELVVDSPGDEAEVMFSINWNTGSRRIVRAPTHLQLETWYHIAATYDGSVARIFIDGQLDIEATWDTPVFQGNNTYRFVLGNNYPGAPEYISGTLDEVRLWNLALTGDEIRSTMSGGLDGTEPGLLAYYPLDEGQGQTAFDQSGQGLDLTLGTSSSPESSDPSWVESDRPGSDYEATLTQDPLIRGLLSHSIVERTKPGELTAFFVSFTGVSCNQGPCLPNLGHVCLDVLGPVFLVGVVRASSSGTAVFSFRVPQQAPLIPVWTQAVVVRGESGELTFESNPVEALIQ